MRRWAILLEGDLLLSSTVALARLCQQPWAGRWVTEELAFISLWRKLFAVKTLFDYQVVCRRDDNGSYVAYVPAIDGCHAIGASPQKAQKELQDVFHMIVEEFAESGRPLPDDVQEEFRKFR